MILREPRLPHGWYPRDKDAIKEFLDPFAKGMDPKAFEGNSRNFASAAVAPHAGWYYSGLCAASAVSSLDRDAGTVAVIGGHLGEGMPILIAGEDGVKTPFGHMLIDRELRDAFKKQVSGSPDRYQDNTVEVLLPMVHYFFPSSRLLWLRFPAELSSFEAGRLLAECAENLGRRIVVLASTDLTHYGLNYGYSPHGSGKQALEWVKKINDAAFVSAVLEGDPSQVLKHAQEDFSACSAGAVLGALGFVDCREKLSERMHRGTMSGTISFEAVSRLLDYRTSADTELACGNEIPDSFVGYAAISLGVCKG